MPLSEDATTGLRAAVEWNPYAARYLLDILRTLPVAVKYKEQDRYGPLSMMLYAVTPMRQITRDVSIPARPVPFPQEKLRYCEAFNAEWLQRRFTKQELADTIEEILTSLAPAPLLEQVNSHTELVLTTNGTFLHNLDDEPDIYMMI